MFRKKHEVKNDQPTQSSVEQDAALSEAARLQMKDEQIKKSGVSSEEHDDVMAALGMPGYGRTK